jgi:hypothetical protein
MEKENKTLGTERCENIDTMLNKKINPWLLSPTGVTPVN